MQCMDRCNTSSTVELFTLGKYRAVNRLAMENFSDVSLVLSTARYRRYLLTGIPTLTQAHTAHAACPLASAAAATELTLKTIKYLC